MRVVAIVDRAWGHEHPFVVGLRHRGVTVSPLLLPPRAYLSEQRAVAALCREFRPDVCHTHGARADVLDSRVAQRLGVPTVTTVHGFTGGDVKNRLYEWLQVRAIRRCDAVTAVSATLAHELLAQGIRREQVWVIPNAWEPREPVLDRRSARNALGVSDTKFHIGWVGRLTPEKGAEVLLKALSRLPEIPWTASVVGDGRCRSALQRRAASLGLSDRLRWHGTVPDAPRLFAAFDVFVISSRTEGTPMALFEAAAAGVPVVATRVGGIPEVVSDEEALLVSPENPTALGNAIAQIWNDRPAAARRARAAHRVIERFAVRPWLERYSCLYHSVVEGNGLAGAARWTRTRGGSRGPPISG